jgi:hypothetical protein
MTPQWPRRPRNLARDRRRDPENEAQQCFGAMVANLGARMVYWTRVDEAEAAGHPMARPSPPAAPAAPASPKRPRPIAPPAAPRPSPRPAPRRSPVASSSWYSAIGSDETEGGECES